MRNKGFSYSLNENKGQFPVPYLLILIKMPHQLFDIPFLAYKKIKAMWQGNSPSILESLKNAFSLGGVTHTSGAKSTLTAKLFESVEPYIVVAASMACLTYFKFSLLAQLFILSATAVMTYQLCWMGGKLGVASAGRFITFVMLPALLLFKMNEIEVFNTLGQKIFSKAEINTPKFEIDLSNHAAGIYFVRVFSLENIFVKKIVLQR